MIEANRICIFTAVPFISIGNYETGTRILELQNLLNRQSHLLKGTVLDHLLKNRLLLNPLQQEILMLNHLDCFLLHVPAVHRLSDMCYTYPLRLDSLNSICTQSGCSKKASSFKCTTYACFELSISTACNTSVYVISFLL